MRPRLLELTAFGPYADTVRIDFGDLGDDGLFLVHGPTGSGKTSILDGMTYALYGGVTGMRRVDRLRSDFADPRTHTAVALEFGLRGTDYRITRTPAHERAKKSGSGTTLQKPKATLSVRREGAWEPVAEGVEEVGRQITDLLGLDREQFSQVVVLPQGAFASALHADARDRRRLLSSLFRTGRFEDYTAALVARAKRAEDEAAQGAAQLARLQVQARDRWCDIAGDSEEPGLVAVDDLATRAAAAADEAAAAVDAAGGVEEATAAALAEARLIVERRRRLAQAQSTLAQLEAAADEVAAARAQLDVAERAQPLEAFLATTLAADAEVERAVAERSSAVRALQECPPATSAGAAAAARDALAAAAADPVDCEALDTARDALHASVVRLTLALSQFEQSQSAALSVAVHTTAGEAHRAAAAAAAARAEALQSRRVELAQLHATATATAERLPTLRDDVVELERVSQAVARVGVLRQRTVDAAAALLRAKQRLNAALDHQRSLLERRIEGMAAELAAGLREGEPCAVCGAVTHPAVAKPGPDAVSAQALQDAQTAVEHARRDVGVHDDAEAAVREELHGVLAIAGSHADDPQSLDATVADAAAALHDANTAASDAARLEGELRDVDDAATTATAQAAASLQAAAAADATAQECSAVALRLAAEVEEVAGVAGDPGPSLESARAAAAAADRLCAAVRAETRLRDEAAASHHRSDQMLVQGGFADAAQAQAALLPPEQRRGLRKQLDEVDRRRAAAEEIVAQEIDVDEDAAPSVDALEETHAAAARALGDAQVRLGAVRSAAGDLVRIAAELARTAALHENCATQAQRLRRLADICSGSGNEHRMSLERYVLAAYFEEIAEAASHRLATMTGGRYTLHHSDARVRGGAASGLSITVQDAYTGTEREAGSLSGGETFQASLCLALAVAEVVQRHAGGVHLDTLFIDEGFGALDGDSLEQAMAELDALREGGRMVGVISHVPALRERINTGIVVTKTARGSDVRVETLAPS